MLMNHYGIEIEQTTIPLAIFLIMCEQIVFDSGQIDPGILRWMLNLMTVDRAYSPIRLHFRSGPISVMYCKI